MPIAFAHGDPAGSDRIHVQPSAASSKGRQKAAAPSSCSSRSLIYAPTTPIQFSGRVVVAPTTVLNDGSVE